MSFFAKLFSKFGKKEEIKEEKAVFYPEENEKDPLSDTEIPENNFSEPVENEEIKVEKKEEILYATDLESAFRLAQKEADAIIAEKNTNVVGRYEFSLSESGYHFYLLANNGQMLFESQPFASLLNALNGISAFRRAVGEDAVIREDKFGRFRFIYARKYYGENYDTRDKCEKGAESVRRFAGCSRIVPYYPTPEEEEKFERSKIARRKASDVDWALVADRERNAKKSGKFKIVQEGEDFAFYLLANNGQILYGSRSYSSRKGAESGIESFKKAVYIGNFIVDKDKFGNYRYVLRNAGSAPAFVGESYTDATSVENIIRSVQKFVVTASMPEEEQ